MNEISLAPLVIQHNIVRISFKKRIIMWWVFLWLLISFLGNNKGAKKNAEAPLVAQHNFALFTEYF